jgi:hypothetical protein
MTPEETAGLLSVSVLWVYEKCRSRQRDPLPVLRIGRYLRFEKDAVIQWARNRGNKAYNQTVAKAGALQ